LWDDAAISILNLYNNQVTITNALNEMLKPGQHDKKNYVIPNLFRNLEFANDNELIAFVLIKIIV
jgi:hypothetical protein